jgi:hypothetical protein
MVVKKVVPSPLGVEQNRKTSLKNDLKVIDKQLVDYPFKSPTKSIESLVNGNWLTHSTQKQLSSYINQQLKSLPLTKEKIHVGIPQLQKVFQPFTQLSKPDDSENGVTAMFGINHSLPFAIMKYGVRRGILQNEELIHEVAVGLVLNELRDICPYFMYTYPALYCNPPYTYEKISNKQHFESQYFCNENYVTTLYMAELCRDSISLEEFIIKIKQKKYSPQALEDVMLQISIALHLAYDKFTFIHNDLHHNNIRIRFLPSPVTMTYRIDDKYIKITTQYIPQIIDYGFTTLTVKGTKLFPNFKVTEPSVYKYNIDVNRIFGIMYDDVPQKYLTQLLTSFGLFFDDKGEKTIERFTTELVNQYWLLYFSNIKHVSHKIYKSPSHVYTNYDSKKVQSPKMSKQKSKSRSRSHKLKRCPKGFHRNKKTGNCDPVKKISPKISKQKSKSGSHNKKQSHKSSPKKKKLPFNLNKFFDQFMFKK